MNKYNKLLMVLTLFVYSLYSQLYTSQYYAELIVRKAQHHNLIQVMSKSQEIYS